MSTTATSAAPAVDPIAGSAVELVRMLNQLERPDLVDRVTAAGARLARPATIVAVVGEFKQGKSSLVNGLLGQSVCPVDDDLATSAITLVRYGEEPGAVVRRRVDDEAVALRIPVGELNEWVSERGNPGNHKGVERVEITVPSAILKQGLVIVDTPGMGGLGAGHAAATLAFLPFADGLILVSDASSEVSAPEVDFLRRASELCPTVMFAQTKTDLYPDWERIVDLNRGHFDAAGLKIPMVAVSSHLRATALVRKNRDLNAASRFPELLDQLADRVVTPAKRDAATRSADDLIGVSSMLRSGLEQQRALIDEPAALAGAIAEIGRANARLEHLRGPAAKWAVLVNDRISDLTTKVTHHLRGSMREISRDMEQQVEQLSRGAQWDELSRTLQSRVADEVARIFVAVEEGKLAIRVDAQDLLQEENVALGGPAAGGGQSYDVLELWRDKSIEGDEKGAKAGLKTALTGARGAQGGVIMFGMMGNFLPGAAAAFMATNPVLLGAGALFGGFQLLEDRKRKVTQRRQNARQQVRQFIDDVQFEVTNEITGLIRGAHRDIRDDFTTRLGELQRTYADSAKAAQQHAKNTQQEMTQHCAALDKQIEALGRIAQVVANAKATRPSTAEARS